MTKSTALFAASVFTAWIFPIMIANPAFAEEKTAGGEVTLKEIQQNDRVRVYEATFKPGDVSPSTKRPMRVVRVLKGGTLERTYEDGTKETSKWKTGETRIISEERPYAVKNVGKSVVHLLIVALK